MQTALSIFEYQAPEQETTFRAVKTALPCPATARYGREAEKTEAVRLLAQTPARLLTLTGPGGVGKTRLALEVAGMLETSFAGGVWYLSLENVVEPEMLGFALARTLELPRLAERPVWQNLKEFFGEKPALLVLDNFEQVAEAAPRLAGLLAGCPGLKLLVTSRVALRICGENRLTIEPLALPETATFEAAARSEAVEFFVKQAQAVRWDFKLTPENYESVSRICARLDGLPLALELAAGWLRLLPPQALLARLESRCGLALLTGGKDLAARHQTLRQNAAWSYDLLSEVEQKLFRHLAAYNKGCTLDEAEKLGENILTNISLGNQSTLELIAGLTEKNVLRQSYDCQCNGEFVVRLSMLQMYRAYGLAQLELNGEQTQAQPVVEIAPVKAPVAAPKSLEGYGLTCREQEVLALLAEGLPDKAIAERLIISPRTVHTHLTTIYSKLDVTTRSAATCLALKAGLAV